MGASYDHCQASGPCQEFVYHWQVMGASSDHGQASGHCQAYDEYQEYAPKQKLSCCWINILPLQSDSSSSKYYHQPAYKNPGFVSVCDIFCFHVPIYYTNMSFLDVSF